MTSIKPDLLGLKDKLKTLGTELNDHLKTVEDNEEKIKEIDKRIEELINTKDEIIKLNIGGKVFKTKISTLLSINDTLFYKVIQNLKETNQKIPDELFFDRSSTYFSCILNYLRTKRVFIPNLEGEELNDFYKECEYYGLMEYIYLTEEKDKNIEIIKFESSPRYSNAGSHKLKDLNNKNMMGGICVQSPYQIIFELNTIHELCTIEVGGWNGNSSLWYVGNGSCAKILTSKNKTKWIEVGVIPSNFGNSISKIKLKKSTCKYIKFSHNSYLGLGYLKLHKN